MNVTRASGDASCEEVGDHLLDAPSSAALRFNNHHVIDSTSLQLVGSRKPCNPCTHNNDPVAVLVGVRRFSLGHHACTKTQSSVRPEAPCPPAKLSSERGILKK
jgi:hypothetical protein